MSDAAVRISTRPMWVVRLGRRGGRILVAALALSGCAAAARVAIAPPSAPPPRAPVVVEHLAAEGFAALFARRYLSWNAADPALHEQGLAPFTGSGIDPDAGLVPPANGSEQVLWADVVQSRSGPAGEEVYTVAVATDAAGLEYLAVPVVHDGAGDLALGGYPAFVGPPAMGSFDDVSASLPQVGDAGLSVVVTRALRNYLADESSNLAADLTPNARISYPTQPLALDDVVSLRWSSADQSVIAQVVASDGRGVQYSLAYEIAVAREQTRWEVTAIEVNPDA